MKRVLAMLGFLALGGCGTVHNLGAGPQVYGGVRYNAAHMVGCAGWNYVFDQPGCAILDTALLPVTVTCVGVRAVTGWPPAENLR